MTQSAKSLAAVVGVITLVSISFAIAGSGSSKDLSSEHPLTHVTPVSAVQDAWRDAGLTAGGFANAPADELDGASCERGAVSGLDVMVCEYPSIDAAAEAPAEAEELIGDNTGAAVAAGTLLVVVSDPYDADPDGSNINTLLNTFRETAGQQRL